MKKVLKILGGVFLSIGLILMAVSFLIYHSTASFRREAASATGTVIDLTLERSGGTDGASVYYPVVEFSTEKGETIRFRGSSGSSPPAFSKGQTVTVRFRSEDPYRARIESFPSMWLGTLITGFIGLPFAITGLIMLLIPIFKARQDAWLQANGRIISAEIDRVDLNRGVRVNGQHPYIMHAQWHDSVTGRIYVFRSRDIWYNPERYIRTKTVQVRIHPKNPKKYMMDTSFLPESGGITQMQ